MGGKKEKNRIEFELETKKLARNGGLRGNMFPQMTRKIIELHAKNYLSLHDLSSDPSF